MSDPQKVTQQAALTTASGRSWLIVAGVISVICLVLFWLMRGLEPLGAATLGIVITVVAYLAMVAVRFGIRSPRLRLWILAVLTLGISASFLIIASVIVLSA